MTLKYKQIEICRADDELLMNACREIFLKAHPEMRGMRITRKFMLAKVIEYYMS
jgi:hypothetical protein